MRDGAIRFANLSNRTKVSRVWRFPPTDAYLLPLVIRARHVYGRSQVGRNSGILRINNPTHPPSVSFSPDGAMLSIEDWSAIHLLEVATFRELRSLDRPQGLQVAFSPDGRMLAASGADPLLVVWDTSTWVVRRHGFHEDVGCPQVAFSPDGQMLAEI
jgi:WD40 repeat protein